MKSEMQGLLDTFWAEQQSAWPLMQKGYADLELVQVRNIIHGGKEFRAQHNPARILSSGAKVDKKSISERPCFLCPHTLSDGQKGLLLQGKYLFLINPFPILAEHFTVPHISHIPQELSSEVISDMAEISELFSGRYDIYYNGASAGASAPDHMHFQAALQGVLPLCEQLIEEWIAETAQYRIGVVESAPRKVILLESESHEGVIAAWEQICALLEDPALLNLILRHDEERWRMWVILRGKHRPECYFLPGEEQMLVSPGVIDMGGVAVLPRSEDFERMDGATLVSILEEVSMPREKFERLVEQLTV